MSRSTSGPEAAPPAERAIRRLSLTALVVLCLLVFGIGGLAATTRLSGAVIAAGALVVDSYVKPVQHPKGGIIGSLDVKNGDKVEAGDMLARLDDTQTRANLAIITKRLDELAARAARLAAERDGEETVAFPKTLMDRPDNRDVVDLIVAERRLFDARKASRTGRKAQLQERIRQLRQEIEGLEAQQSGKRQEIALIEKELTGIRKLFEQGLAAATRMHALEREAARLTGELGALTAAKAQAHGKIAETELQVIQIDDDQRSEVSEEIRKIQGETGEFTERLVAAEDELKRIDIRAPQSGIVHQLAVHAAGAVIGAGDPVMQIVPIADTLIAEVKLAPQDIDQIAPGQKVLLRFSAFNQRTTPEIDGTVARIGADLTHDPQTGLSYYIVRLTIDETQWRRLGHVTPVPGMPVEAFIQTGERTALSYFTKPLTDQFARAFREE